MSSTYISLHYHVIFATKNREPYLLPKRRDQIYEYLGGIVRGLGGHPLGIGGVDDHVHLLMSLKATHCLSDFMRELKKSSSSWIRESFQPQFHWQEGYAAFSVSASARPSVQSYIARQEEHHRKMLFREELVDFLLKSGVEFDETYLE